MNKHSLEWFWDGCEAQGPFTTLIKLPGQPHTLEHVLYQPFAVVGRDLRAHLRLEDGRVSLRHAYFQVIGGQLFVMDLGSPSGIQVKDNSVRAGWVPRGDRVGIGPFWLRWRKDAPADPDAAVPGFDPRVEPLPGNALMPLSLEFLNGKTTQPRWQVDRAMTLIGSAASCKVRLRSSRIAAFHCTLLWTSRGAWIVDLLGEGGVRLNGVPVQFACLDHDDRLQVGEFVIRVCCGATSDVSPGPAAATRQDTAAVNGKQAVLPMLPAPSPLAAFSANTAAAFLQTAEALRMPALAPPETVGNPTHEALLPLLSQFGAMQEQMADQFRQTLMTMFQMFNALHKDQMAFFQQEMDRVQELTHELQLLQREVAKQASAPHGPAYQAAGRSGLAPKPTPLPALSVPAPPPFPTSPASQQTPMTGGSNVPDAPADQDIHVWLLQRMSAVQEERQSRWQKLLGMLGGKRPDVD